MSQLTRWIPGALLLAALLLPVSDTAAQAESPLTFSVDILELQGVIGEDTFAVSFHLLTNTDEVSGVKLLPSDLINEDGKVIAASQYQISPTSISSIPPNNGELVNVTVSNVPASGTYSGTIEVLFDERDPKTRLTLEIRLIATSKTDLKLASDSSLVAIEGKSGLLWWNRRSNPVSFSLRQEADSVGKISQITVIGPPESITDADPIPPSTVIISPDLPLEIGSKRWETFTVQIDTSDLKPGHYAGTIVVTPETGDEKTVTLVVKLRDDWPVPLVVLLLGVSFSVLISWWATTGSARMQSLNAIDAMRAQVEASALLPSDFRDTATTRLDELEAQASKGDPSNAQAGMEAFKAELTRRREIASRWLEQINDWRDDLTRWSVRGLRDEYVKALMSNPLEDQMRFEFSELDNTIAKGSYSNAEVHARLQQMAEDMATLGNLVKVIPSLPESPDEQIKTQVLPNLMNILLSAESLHEGDLKDLVQLLKSKGLIDVKPAPIEAFSAPEGEELPTGLIARIRHWFDEPRNVLPLLNRLLSLLFLALLLAAGMQALYVGKPTFGGERFADYLGLLLWGIGADASRKQLKDLESAAGFLRQRLGVQPKAS